MLKTNKFFPIALSTVAICYGCTSLTSQNRDESGKTAVKIAGTPQQDLSRYRSPLTAHVIDRRFNTVEAMYLANEMELGAFDFVTRAAVAGLPVDPDFIHIATTESYWYSRYNMSALTTESRMGIGVVYSPYITEWALREGRSTINRDRTEYVRSNKGVLLQEITPLYLQRSGFPRRFEDASPIMLTFASGDPHYVRPLDKGTAFESTENLLRNADLRKIYGDDYKAPPYGIDVAGNEDWKYRVNYRENFLSLRWNTDDMDPVIDMGAEGQVLMKQVLWAEFFLAGKHHNNEYLGITPEDGYRGAMLNLMAVSKMLMLKSALLYDGKNLVGVDPRTATPGQYYFPHRVAARLRQVGDLMPRLEEFTVEDNSSQLFDQASLLWGLSEFYRFADPSVKSAWNDVFGENTPYDGSLMEQKYIVLAEGLANMIIGNMRAMHQNADGTFSSSWKPESERNGVVSTTDLGMSLVALSTYIQHVHTSPQTRIAAADMLEAQANFILKNLQTSNGSVKSSNAVSDVGGGQPPSLEAQAFAMRGLLDAYKVLKNPVYLDAAKNIFAYMNMHLWDEKTGIYRTYETATHNVYTPLNLGATLGSLREILLATQDRKGLERYKRFWVQAVNVSGIQQSEYEETGETDLTLGDGDNDGIPRMEAGDGEFGIAPVFASKVDIVTE